MAGKFELYKDARGEYRFRLKAGNGEVIATGEATKPRRARRTASSRCRATRPGRRWSTRPSSPGVV